MLVLFDVDMTLLTTRRAGMDALLRAGRELFGDGFSDEGVDFAGRLDPLIVRDLLRVNGLEPSAGNERELRARYGALLKEELSEPGRVRALPGVHELLDLLGACEGVALGLLTGNYEETGTLKIGAAGISLDPFAVRVWGDDSSEEVPAREHLPPIGMARFRERFGREARKTVIIGDTEHDVACARANGCVSVGVATGMTSAEDLRVSGADLVLENLVADEIGGGEELVRWLTA